MPSYLDIHYFSWYLNSAIMILHNTNCFNLRLFIKYSQQKRIIIVSIREIHATIRNDFLVWEREGPLGGPVYSDAKTAKNYKGQVVTIRRRHMM